MPYLLAVDGGGTSCRAAVAAPDGTVLGRATTGAANIASNPEGAAASIIEAARKALAAAGLDSLPLRDLHAYLGLAGANVSADAARLASRLPFADTRIVDDATIALQGALGSDNGVIAILGTGSVYIGRNGESVLRAGGWGFMVGDLGSGARLGRALLQDTLLAYDRILPRSELTRFVLREFGDDPARLVTFAQGQEPGGFARFAPLVFEYAERGDEVGASLVRGAVAHVNAALAAVTWPGCERLCLLGGLAGHYRNRIEQRFRSILQPAKGDALKGAIELGLQSFQSAGSEQ
jgi:glucosamine kinase